MGTNTSKLNSTEATEATSIELIYNGNIIDAEYTEFGGQYTFVNHEWFEEWINALNRHLDIKERFENNIIVLDEKEIHEEDKLVIPIKIRGIISSHDSDENTVTYLKQFTEFFDQEVIEKALNLKYGTQFSFVHEACFSGKPKTLEFLYRLGANFDLMDHSGRTPIDVVNNVCRCKQGDCEHQKCVQFLEKNTLQCQVCKKAGQVRGHNEDCKVILCDEHHTGS